MNLQQAILFATGFLVSLVSALIARKSAGKNQGAGWVYLGSITLRLMGLLIGCTAIYLSASGSKEALTGAFALGVAAGWIAHFATALVMLKK